jgi:hypothetical protein
MTKMMAAALGIAAIFASPAVYAQQQPQEPTELKADAAQEPGGGSGDGFVAKLRRFADDTRIVDRLNGDIDGWYPRLGGMTTGSGFALGPGYRTHVFDGNVLVDLSAAVTKKGYKAVDAKAEWLHERYENLELWTNFRYQDFPQEDFFGFGGTSTPLSRTNYALESTDISALGIYHVKPWMRVGTELGYFQPTVGHGSDPHVRSIETLYTDAEAPGLAAQPDFLHTTVFTEIDYRDERGNPRSGGYYKAALGVWDDRGLEQFDFRRLDLEAAQYVPIVTKTHVIASRLGMAFVNNSLGERVPFYFVPYVGGSHTIRSFDEFRFQDENAFWWNTEYRWQVHRHVSAALFYDLGNVHHNWDSLFSGELKKAYGVGFRVNSSSRVFVRLDIGTGGNEGRQIFFKLSPAF